MRNDGGQIVDKRNDTTQSSVIESISDYLERVCFIEYLTPIMSLSKYKNCRKSEGNWLTKKKIQIREYEQVQFCYIFPTLIFNQISKKILTKLQHHQQSFEI